MTHLLLRLADLILVDFIVFEEQPRTKVVVFVCWFVRNIQLLANMPGVGKIHCGQVWRDLVDSPGTVYTSHPDFSGLQNFKGPTTPPGSSGNGAGRPMDPFPMLPLWRHLNMSGGPLGWG